MAKHNAPHSTNGLRVVLPGDNVTEHVLPKHSSESSDTELTPNAASLPKLGTGLRYDESTRQVFATAAGRLHNFHRVYYVLQDLRRYRPALEDRVVGIVEDRVGSDGAGGDIYRVNLGAAHPALLSSLSFEGASKRNKPHLQPGQLLYARVAALHTSGALDPELSCVLGPHDQGVPRRDWMTNEGCYGELKGGKTCRVSTGLARELLQPDNVVLAELSKAKLSFEVAVGVNGFLWIHSHSPEYTILIQNAIQNSAVLTEEQVRGMVRSLVYTVNKQLQQERDASNDSD